jgi:hypothetical protein
LLCKDHAEKFEEKMCKACVIRNENRYIRTIKAYSEEVFRLRTLVAANNLEWRKPRDENGLPIDQNTLSINRNFWKNRNPER